MGRVWATNPADLAAGAKFPRKQRVRVGIGQQAESTLQARLEMLLQSKGYRFGKDINHAPPGKRIVRIPDQAYRYLCSKEARVPLWVKAVVAKYFKNISDLIILNGPRYMVWELKRKGKDARQGQRKWMKGLPAHVVDDYQEGVRLLKEFEDEKN